MDEVQSVEEGFFWLSKALLTNPELLQYRRVLRSQNDDGGNYDLYQGRSAVIIRIRIEHNDHRMWVDVEKKREGWSSVGTEFRTPWKCVIHSKTL